MPHSNSKDLMFRRKSGQKKLGFDWCILDPQRNCNDTRDNGAMKIMLKPVNATYAPKDAWALNLGNSRLRVPSIAKRAEYTSGDNRETHLAQRGELLHCRREPLWWDDEVPSFSPGGKNVLNVCYLPKFAPVGGQRMANTSIIKHSLHPPIPICTRARVRRSGANGMHNIPCLQLLCGLEVLTPLGKPMAKVRKMPVMLALHCA